MSAFNDFVLKPYGIRRRELMNKYPDDPQGFLVADGRLRLRIGLDLTQDHEDAMIANTRAFAELLKKDRETKL